MNSIRWVKRSSRISFGTSVCSCEGLTSLLCFILLMTLSNSYASSVSRSIPQWQFFFQSGTGSVSICWLRGNAQAWCLNLLEFYLWHVSLHYPIPCCHHKDHQWHWEWALPIWAIVRGVENGGKWWRTFMTFLRWVLYNIAIWECTIYL